MQLPPLNALRSFEAAARHLSFTRAAAELCVTQGAVSQQVKQLETALDVALFQRTSGGLRLTRKGEEYAAEIRAALRRIRDATAALRREGNARGLTLSCLPSFAHKWLMPRLGRFLERHPEVSLRIHTGFDLVDFARDGIDCAIRHGPGRYPGCFAEILLTEELTPMCSPAVAAELSEPRDLARVVLLRDFGTDWTEWLVQAGLDDLEVRMGPEFLDSSMAMQAAIDGRGVILGHTALARDDLLNKRLVAPFALRVPYDCAHWFVCPAGNETQPQIAALYAWLREEAAAFPAPAIGKRRSAVPRPLPYS